MPSPNPDSPRAAAHPPSARRPAVAARERRDQSRAETRRVILDATEALLLELGPEGFSVRKLVDRCGYSAPTIYHHFNDKQGLIDALLEERLERLAEEIEAVPQGRDPVENLRALMRAFARFGLQNPTHYQLLTQTHEDDLHIIEAAERARTAMETPSEEIARRGWIVLGDEEVFRQAVWSTVHGIVAMRALRPDVEWSDQLLDLSIEGLVRGWLLPASERKISHA